MKTSPSTLRPWRNHTHQRLTAATTGSMYCRSILEKVAYQSGPWGTSRAVNPLMHCSDPPLATLSMYCNRWAKKIRDDQVIVFEEQLKLDQKELFELCTRTSQVLWTYEAWCKATMIPSFKWTNLPQMLKRSKLSSPYPSIIRKCMFAAVLWSTDPQQAPHSVWEYGTNRIGSSKAIN